MESVAPDDTELKITTVIAPWLKSENEREAREERINISQGEADIETQRAESQEFGAQKITRKETTIDAPPASAAMAPHEID